MTLVVAVAETVVVGEVDDEVGEAMLTQKKPLSSKSRIDTPRHMGSNGKPGTFQEILNMEMPVFV